MIDINMKMTIWPIQERLHIWEGKSSEQTWQREKQFGGRGFGIYELIRTISISSPCLGSGDFGKRNGCGNGLSM